ncbi:uncharacterized protein [Anabrus simplex]|uniref:uncharacterized protein isoform X2 n=1 Tax=Anabrus simplex TaxID=316456 RepID=UPI0035A2A4E6
MNKSSDLLERIQLLNSIQKDALSERFGFSEYWSHTKEEIPSTVTGKESLRLPAVSQTSASLNDAQSGECEVDSTVMNDVGNDKIHKLEMQMRSDEHVQQLVEVSQTTAQQLVISQRQELKDSNIKNVYSEFQSHLIKRNFELEQHLEKAKLLIKILGFTSYITNFILENDGANFEE